MARVPVKSEKYPNHINPDNLIFSVFTTEEIKKLCVTKICTPLTLDNLGHPLPGGLYDKSLGPLTVKSDPCGTCHKNIYQCPGHFGYIELPLPLINPIFHKIVGVILKISCLSCFKIQISVHLKLLLAIQIKLLNCGMVTEALEVQQLVSELIATHASFENIPEELVLPVKKYQQIAENALEKLEGKITVNKNTEMLRNNFINDMLKEVKPRKSCMYCKQGLSRMSVLKNKIILHQKNFDSDEAAATSRGRVKSVESKFITPEESRTYMRNIWREETELMQQIVSVLNDIDSKFPTDIFYFEVIPVPPPNVRPVNVVGNMVSEHPQTRSYKSILHNSILLRAIIQVVQNKGEINSLPVEAKGAYSLAEGNSPVEKLNHAWEAIQNDINILVDSSSVGQNADNLIGLKQIIEKKQGVIRKHMMGKRVNFAARSVITPDPNLNVDEIGIPETFAKHLTYPVAVTSWNVEELRKMVLNGPDVHPGAVMIEFEDGTISRINSGDVTQKKSLLKRLLTPDDKEKFFKGVKTVHRHLCNGDILLLNRQPTLHKPSIMAHKARILKGEKTLRLHYANCKAYNADFDGDEMNAHFPQNEVARSEGYNLANVCNQYLVPKDGTPLSGLIQDHMVSGVRLSLRGKFFNKNDYHQLVFQALAFMTGEIKLLPPAIIKPINLWSGKQILSTIIINITPKGYAHINLTHVSKIPSKAWECKKPRKWKAGGIPFTNDNIMSEGEVIIRSGELLVGVLDKTHYGATPYGLIHCFYELYGGLYATRLLSSFAKLFTRFLQQEGFTLGVHDILVVKKADKKRAEVIKNLRQIGKKTITTALDIPDDTKLDDIVKKIDKESVTNPKLRSIIDRQYKSALDSYTNDINKTCLPAGLVCKFPQNNLQLMVQSGAKGSTVNTMQISCLLGQIELEGKRPPIMICGKSLPSFPASEFTPRAGGFIDGRFMTGIQPQEFFFHCMAGREGLIDTAVKTSRSGYLQRCLIKHLEGLTVGYDMTVRDSDRSVIQFLYGEDGMDISKVQFLNPKQMQFLSENTKAMINKKILKQLSKDEDQLQVQQFTNKINEWVEKHGNPFERKKKNPFVLFSQVVKSKVGDSADLSSTKIAEMWLQSDETLKQSFKKHCGPCPDPLNSVFQPDAHFGSLNERLQNIMNKFETSLNKKNKKNFQNMLKLKSMQSLCSPGEPVGLLAAQSIGEPSTQMTLNTFHFAGRGEMNVTLGIPRLREILMMASKNLKTPSMEIPFLDVPNLEKKAEKLRKRLSKVVLANVLEKIDVTVVMELNPARQHTYKVRFHFLPYKLYKSEYCVKADAILKHMTKKFFSAMFAAIRKHSKITSNIVMMEEEKKKPRGNAQNSDDENETPETETAEQGGDDSSDEEPEDVEDAKMNNKFQDVKGDQEPEDEERELSDDEIDNPESTGKEKSENVGEESSVVDDHHYAKHYTFDKVNASWCEIIFALPLNVKKLDLTGILKDIANKSVIWETPQIRRAITYMKEDKLTLRTDGINIVEMFKHNKLLDLNKLYCNDIHRVADTYGIEAARKIIVKEVKDVFNVYGIKVDPRHLLLIADYMTFNGTFEPLSRKGMDSSASPLQQMSFESSLTFLKAAVIRGKQDQLKNPSSCLMVGKPCETGTGCFSLFQNTPVNMKTNAS